MFRPGIYLPAETARIHWYGRYFFRYEIGDVPILVHWPVRYSIDNTVWYMWYYLLLLHGMWSISPYRTPPFLFSTKK